MTDQSKTQYHPILVTMYFWYTWFLVRHNANKQVLQAFIGTWAPLWIITMFVRLYEMNQIDDDDSSLSMDHIEYVVKKTRTIDDKDVTHRHYYDITERSLWYFYFIGDCYKEYIEYARGLIPYGLEDPRFNVTENEIEVKYTGQVDDEFCMLHLILGQNGKYTMRMNEDPEIEHNVKFNTLEFVNIY